jgi:hypothetical protein
VELSCQTITRAVCVTAHSGNRGSRRFVGAVAALLDARVLPLRNHLRTGGGRSELDDEGVELPEFFLDEVEGRAEAFRERLADALCHSRSVDDGVVIRVFRFQRGDGGGGDAVSRCVRFRDDALGTLDDELGFREQLLVAETLPCGFGEVDLPGLGFPALVGEPEGDGLGEDVVGVLEFGFLTLLLLGDAAESGLLFFCIMIRRT